MNVCPHCRTEGVGAWRKWTSSTACPAACRVCGGFSLVPVVTSSAILVACILGLVGVGLVAALLKSAYPWGIGVPLVACFYVWRWKVASLIPASMQAAGEAKKAGWILTSLFALLSLVQ